MRKCVTVRKNLCYKSAMKCPLHLRLVWPALLVFASATVTASIAGPVGLLRVPEGGLQPKAAADGNGRAHLVYLKGDPKACDVFYAKREAGRTNFGKPVCVNSQPGCAIAIGTVRGADIAVSRRGFV